MRSFPPMGEITPWLSRCSVARTAETPSDCPLLSRRSPTAWLAARYLGPKLPKREWLSFPDVCVRFLWVLPITATEASFTKLKGLEALEQKFDAVELDYLNPGRASVV